MSDFCARGMPVPDEPASADLSVISGEALKLDWTAPLSDGGAAVQSYRVSPWLLPPTTRPYLIPR
jgi:hypothetical protein